MDEQRRNERKRLLAFTPVYDAHTRVILGYLGDLSLQGAMLIGEKSMDVNTQLLLEMDFPSTLEFPARRVRIPARVAWCRREEKTQYFNTGFEFQRLDDLYRPYVQAILETYQFRREMPG